MKKLLAISHSDSDPASRFRVMQLLPYFRAMGWQTDHRPIYPSLYRQARFAGTPMERLESYAVEKLRWASSAWVHRRAGRYDVVLVNRELPRNAALLLRRNPRVIFDFDDAIHLGAMPEHVAFMCRQAACTVVGNEFLAAAVRGWSREVRIIPTLVDIDTYAMKSRAPRTGPIRVAWLGSPYSIEQTLFPMLGLLAKIQTEIPFQLVIVSKPRPNIPPSALDWRYVEWSPEVECGIADLAEIGIMPLRDNEFQRGKCGLKLLEYLAAGLPAVASPIGVNAAILRESGAGFAASTPEEWQRALGRLCADADLRARMGTQGRAYCAAHYSVRAWLPAWLETLDHVAAGRRARL